MELEARKQPWDLPEIRDTVIIVSRPQKLAAVRGTTLYTEYTPVSQPNGRLPAHYLVPPVITTASYQSGDITKRVHFILFAL